MLGHARGAITLPIVRAARRNWWIQQVVASGGFRELLGASVLEEDLLAMSWGLWKSPPRHLTLHRVSAAQLPSLSSLLTQTFYLGEVSGRVGS